MPDPYSQGSAGYTVPGPQGAPGGIGPTGPAGQSTAALVQSTALVLGRAAQLDPAQPGKIRSVVDAVKRFFVGLVTTTQASGTQQTYVHGPIPISLIDLGTGVAGAVGVNASGVPVRVSDPTCVSGLNHLGRCDEAGAMWLSPARAPCYDVRDYGAVPGDPAKDVQNLAAFNACLSAWELDHVNQPQGQVITAPGVYWLSGTLNVWTRTSFRGAGSSDPNKGPGTMLVFPPNCDGVHFRSGNEQNPDTGRYSTAAYSDWHGIAIVVPTPGDAVQSTVGYGIRVHSPVWLSEVNVEGFGYDNWLLSADSGYLTGNTSTTLLLRCRSGLAGRHGFHLFGGDVNICSIINCRSQGAYGWGVLDETGLGNTYVGHHGEGAHGAIFNLTASIDAGSSVAYVIDTTPDCTSGTSNDEHVPRAYVGGFASQLSKGQQIQIAGVSGTKVVDTISAPTSKASLAGVIVTASASGKSFSRPSGSWVLDGFLVGDYVRSHGWTNPANNGLALKVTAVDAGSITFGGESIADEVGASGAVTLYCTRVPLTTTADATVVGASVVGGYVVDSKNHDYRVKGAVGNDGDGSGVNTSTLTGCYTEFAINDVHAPASVHGGLLASFPMFSGSCLALGGEGPLNDFPITATNRRGTKTVQARLGASDDDMVAFRLATPDVSEGETHFDWVYNDVSGWWSLRINSNSSYAMFDMPNIGRGDVGYEANAVLFQNGFFFGYYSNLIRFDYGSSPPVAGTFVTGAHRFNTSPSVGEPFAWRCVSAGVPGTWEALYGKAYAYTPTDSADAAGEPGDTTYDASYLYVKTGSGWRRTAVESF